MSKRSIKTKRKLKEARRAKREGAETVVVAVQTRAERQALKAQRALMSQPPPVIPTAEPENHLMAERLREAFERKSL